MGEFIDAVFLCSRYDGNLRVASNPRMVYLGAMASGGGGCCCCMWNEIKARGTTRPRIDPKMGAIVPATGKVWLWLARRAQESGRVPGCLCCVVSVWHLCSLSDPRSKRPTPRSLPFITLDHTSRIHLGTPHKKRPLSHVSDLTGKIGVVAPSARDQTAFVPLPVSAAELQLRVLCTCSNLRLRLYSYHACTRGPVISGRKF